MVAEDKRMESRKAYYFYKSRGICTKCGQYDAAPGRVMCEVCLAKNAERKHRKVELMSHEEKEQYLKRMSISRKNLYYKRKNAGLCTKCGKPQAENSATLCPVCLKKMHEIDRKRKKLLFHVENFLHMAYVTYAVKIQFWRERNYAQIVMKKLW